MKVDRYVEPVEYDRWKRIAEDLGFLYVASGPLVRSSYKVSVDRSPTQFLSDCFFFRRVNTSSRMFFGTRGQRNDPEIFQFSIQ